MKVKENYSRTTMSDTFSSHCIELALGPQLNIREELTCQSCTTFCHTTTLYHKLTTSSFSPTSTSVGKQFIMWNQPGRHS